MRKNIGRQKIETDTLSVKETYISLAKKDEQAARKLVDCDLYNEAIYMYVQAMEKKIKGYICGKVDALNPYFAEKLRDIGHSLDKSIEFLIEILAGNNNTLKIQLTEQLKFGVFQNINFSQLHNDCRYPKYNSFKKCYSILQFSKEDCLNIADINKQLDRFIEAFDRL